MPAAPHKNQLVEVCEAEFARLLNVLDTVPDDLATRKGPDDISIKDIIGHRPSGALDRPVPGLVL